MGGGSGEPVPKRYFTRILRKFDGIGIADPVTPAKAGAHAEVPKFGFQKPRDASG
jgi:hypothetical protein